MSVPAEALAFDEAVLEEVAAQLDLRDPNRDAIKTLALRMLTHYDSSEETFEGVLDAATGVGKTYIIAGAIDYFAKMGIRNFAVIVPGQTILSKTVAQFGPGPKSLLGGMSTAPVVITAENFRSPAIGAAMSDEAKVKLFVFTVQSLIRPSTKVGRRTHAFQEGLGAAFYEHLDALEDLIVFADEHHCYYGEKFSLAVRDLTPLALVGLTGTPHPKTPADQIIFRYPLTAAIAEHLVKTPVIVGRRDDLVDEQTQLLDGVRLLEAKQATVDKYCAQSGSPGINATMLVNCKDIEHAEAVGAILRSKQFYGGAYEDAVLVVHSNQADEALAALEGVEESDSPVRIIVQVGMLKEGWDVKSVYVIASLRSSVSEILTEQTMGRGLRLPFGAYTGWDMLDTLDILAHEQYEKVLARTKALTEAFVDHRTVIVERKDMNGQTVQVVEEVPVRLPVVLDPALAGTAEESEGAGGQNGGAVPAVRITTQDAREGQAGCEPPLIYPREDAPPIHVPVVQTNATPGQFSLQQVTDLSAYRDLGRRLAASPDDALRRMKIAAHIVKEADGSRSTQLATSQAADRILSPAAGLPPDVARERIIAAVRQSRVVPARRGEAAQAERLLHAVLTGAGERAEALISRYPDRVARDLLGLILRDQGRLATPAQTYEEVRTELFAPGPRPGRAQTSTDHVGAFRRTVAYGGWGKSLHPHVVFDSSPERTLAVLLDGEEDVRLWIRLAINDLPILWGGGAHAYNPDFLVLGREAERWLIEVKADRDLEDVDVQAKRQAALSWANAVNGSGAVSETWHYLLASESNLKAARGSWTALLAATAP